MVPCAGKPQTSHNSPKAAEAARVNSGMGKGRGVKHSGAAHSRSRRKGVHEAMLTNEEMQKESTATQAIRDQKGFISKCLTQQIINCFASFGNNDMNC